MPLDAVHDDDAPTRWHPPAAAGLVPLPPWLLRAVGARTTPSPARVDRMRRALHEGDPEADAVIAWQHAAGDAALAPRRALAERAIDEGLAALGDAAPPCLVAMLAPLEAGPAWLDRAAVARGTGVLLRLGRQGNFALGTVSLMSGYLSLGAVKPLVATGFLETRARRRLAETLKFVRDVATSGAIAPGSDGYRTTLRVRLLHATLRRTLARAPTWSARAWGLPINQSDMVGTVLEFSVAYVAGLAAQGHVLGARDREDVMHVWRWEATLLGVAADLVPRSFADAVEATALVNRTEAGPDDDGRRLARALFEAWGGDRPVATDAGPFERAWARLEGPYLTGLSRFVLGSRAADALGLPRDAWRFAPIAVAPFGVAEELAVRLSSRLRRRAEARGRARLEADLAVALEGAAPTFRA